MMERCGRALPVRRAPGPHPRADPAGSVASAGGRDAPPLPASGGGGPSRAGPASAGGSRQVAPTPGRGAASPLRPPGRGGRTPPPARTSRSRHDPMRLATKSLLLALLLAAVPFAARAAAELTVFGDSYSVPVHDGVPTWVTQLKAQGVAGPVHDFARSGAVAAPVGGNTFAAQIRRCQAG